MSLAAFLAFVTVSARSQGPVFHIVVAAFTGALTALALVMLAHERLHPDDVWTPSHDVVAQRLSGAARAATVLAALIGVIAAFIIPQWRTHAATPVVALTIFAYMQERLRPTSKKEPICRP